MKKLIKKTNASKHHSFDRFADAQLSKAELKHLKGGDDGIITEDVVGG